MGSIKIQDSGYIESDNSGTQASIFYRANNGEAISLKTAEFKIVSKKNLSNTPNLASNEPSGVNIGSLENLNFTIRCMLTKDNSTDMALIRYLMEMVQTNGYKLLWYDYTSSVIEKNTSSVLYQVARGSTYGDQLSDAEKTAFTISDNFYTLHVLFETLTMPDTAKKGSVMFELSGKVLPVKVSVL